MARKISEMSVATSLDGSEQVEIVQGGTNKRASILAIANAGGTTSWKNSVAVATTANITLSGEQTIDGVLTSSSRVLVKNQTNQTENGIWVSAAGAWTRATDADATAELQNAVVSVDQGTTNADTAWRQTTDNVSIGVSNIIWTAFEGTSVYKGTASGTNTYTVTVTPSLAAYSANQEFTIKFTNANTSTATLNVSSLGAKSIVKNGSVDLESGDISAGQILKLIYDGTNFQIVSNPSKLLRLGGNTTGANITVGTNDAYSFGIETNGTTRVTWDSSGLAGFNVSPFYPIHIRSITTTPSTGIVTRIEGTGVTNGAGSLSVLSSASYNPGDLSSNPNGNVNIAAIQGVSAGSNLFCYHGRIRSSTGSGILITTDDNAGIATGIDGYLGYLHWGASSPLSGNFSKSLTTIRKYVNDLNGFNHTGSLLELVNQGGATGDFINCNDGTNPLFTVTSIGVPILRSYTVATVPTASSYTQGLIYVSDETGGSVIAFSDGTNWRRVTDRAIIS
jgi:hypothetical protein